MARHAYWWVNQLRSFRSERDGGYLWAGVTSPTGRRLRHHTDMERLAVGDVCLHYAAGAIRAVSQITEATSVRTIAGFHDGRPSYVARADYHDLDPGIPLSIIPRELRVPASGPFRVNGWVRMGYIFPVIDSFVATLAERHCLEIP